MDILVNGRHLEITDPIRDYTHEKAGKLSRYFDRISKVEVVLTHKDAHSYDVEMIAHVDGHEHFVSHGTHDDVYTAIDTAESKLARQLTDHKDKLVHRNRG
ncbi:ribosome hibernation-promoting factor, HPF/YfiA family [Algisphaera agarilytica]|uniref:Ribosome hibernation promoting factor n=1 Tax=Algisphaera agarilytica TaxID=1385975 RepID=A0A7X0H3U5_9BACT|nr:ribosome-associated translation inhibitor RaiA [Algisphaera agarilytica]MBB6428689.1 putative sigma-54 modulation protein [Algisphaera agarilytica]